MLNLVNQPIAAPNLALPPVLIQVDRLKLAKRLWRGVADDGMEFGFELEIPLKPEQTVFETSEARYVIGQMPEDLLEISLDVPASAAAGIGWAVGNLHLDLSSEPSRLLTPDDRAARQLLDRIGIPYRPTRAVFRPGRFTRGERPSAASAQELGPSHQH